MPVTQARMLAVLSEADECHDALVALRASLQQVLDSDLDAGMVVVALAAIMGTSGEPSMAACAVERAHFARVRRRNEKNACYMRGKRQEAAE